jgi:hypothetical protein
MLTEREYKKIQRYAGIAFQTKSDFIRSAVRRRIAEINKSMYPELPPARERPPNLRKLVIGDLKDALNAYKDGVFLEKPDEKELMARVEAKMRRQEELEKVKQALDDEE